MSSSIINIGLIGLGRIGKMHAINLHKNLPMFNLRKIVDLAPDLNFISGLDKTHHSTDVDDIILDNTIDAVVVCSPTPTHYDIIKKCAANNKHVFCEKPISFYENEIEEIMQIMNDQKIFIQVGLNRRFDQDFVLAKEKVDAGMVGDIKT